MAELIGIGAAGTGCAMSAAFVWIGWRWLRDPSMLRRAGEAMGHTGRYGAFVTRALPIALMTFGLVTAALTVAAVASALVG